MCNRRLDGDTFIVLSNEIHDNIYNYGKVDFRNTKVRVVVTCDKHGDFFITPHHHLQGQGCPNCKRSKGELLILKYLNNKGINYIQQHFFKDLLSESNRYLFFDFYIPDYNLCIEFDGIQHFIPSKYFGGDIGFKQRVQHDELKNKYCDKNNIKLV